MDARFRTTVMAAALVALGGCDEVLLPVNSPCETNTDCASVICYLGICASNKPRDNREPCLGPRDCKSFRCVEGRCKQNDRGQGSMCRYGEECASTMCTPQPDKYNMKCAAVAKPAPQPWARAAGGTGDDAGRDIAVDGKGNVYVAGWYKEESTFGSLSLKADGSNKQVFVTKLDKDGDFIWATSLKTDIGDGRNKLDIAVDGSGNQYVTGHFSKSLSSGCGELSSHGVNDVFLVKLDKGGKCVWAIKAGGTRDDWGRGLAIDSAGNVYITGLFHGTFTVGATQLTSKGATKTGADMFVVKLDPKGKEQWATNAGGAADTNAASIALDAKGNIYVTGNFGQYGKPASIGSDTLTSSGGSDMYVAKLGPAGKFLWATSAGGTGWDSGEAVVVDSAGNVYVAGSFHDKAVFGKSTLTNWGKEDVFVARLDEGGKFKWAISGGGSEDDEALGLVLGAKGDLYVTGAVRSATRWGSKKLSHAGGADAFVVKISGSGALLEDQVLGGAGDDFGGSIALDTADKIHVTGSFQKTMTIGSTKLTVKGKHDAFIARLK